MLRVSIFFQCADVTFVLEMRQSIRVRCFISYCDVVYKCNWKLQTKPHDLYMYVNLFLNTNLPRVPEAYLAYHHDFMIKMDVGKWYEQQELSSSAIGFVWYNVLKCLGRWGLRGQLSNQHSCHSPRGYRCLGEIRLCFILVHHNM